MKVMEIKVIYESDDILKTQKIISNIFYDFGATGLKIEEPLKHKNPLDFYKNEKDFLMVDNAISAYFPINPYTQKRFRAIEDRLNEIFEDSEVVYLIDSYEYDEEDYENNWKKYLYPEKVSERFVVKPTWREYTPVGDELIIELDPGRAFGTGSHPTTSLCLKLMEENIKENMSVIDVGTGSGILMVAAAKLGASEVFGTDIDDLAIEASRENLELNDVVGTVLLGDLVTATNNKKFDMVVANILADVLIMLLPQINKVIKSNGKVIFSGIIKDKLEIMKKEIARYDFHIDEIKEDKEWRAILLSK